MNIGLFNSSCQMIGLKGLNIFMVNEGYPGVIIRKFGEDKSNTLSMWLFFSKNLLGVTTQCPSKLSHLLQTTIV